MKKFLIVLGLSTVALFVATTPAAALKYAPVNNSSKLQPIPPLQGQPNVSGNVNYSEGNSSSLTPASPDKPRPDNLDNQPQQLDSFQQQVYQNIQEQVASQKQRDIDAQDAAKAIRNLRIILIALQASMVGVIYILYKLRGKSVSGE